MENLSGETNPKDIVIMFLSSLNNEDFDTARQYIADDVTFDGVMGSRHGGDVYMEDMKKMKFKYNIKKVFDNEDDVAVFYDINMSGKTIFSCGWYKTMNGRIQSFKVVFDPRPLLEEGRH